MQKADSCGTWMGRKGASLPSKRVVAASTPGAVGLADVPVEVLLLVARHLGGWELSTAVCVCRQWRAALCGQGELWRAALERDFRESTPAFHSAEVKRIQQKCYYGNLVDPEARATRTPPWAHGGQSFEAWAMAALTNRDYGERSALRRSLNDVAGIYMAGGPPELQRAEAAAVAEAHASGVTPRASWRRVRVAERPQQLPTWRTLRSWSNQLSYPYKIEWRNEPAKHGVVHHRSSRAPSLVVHAPPCNGRRSPHPDYHMYRQLAWALLRGRCRVCLCRTTARHPVLGVPMCAELRCAGAFPVVTAEAAARMLGAAGGGEAARKAQGAGAVVGERSGRRRRGGAEPQPVLLVSAVARLAAEAAGERRNATRAAEG